MVEGERGKNTTEEKKNRERRKRRREHNEINKPPTNIKKMKHTTENPNRT